MTEIISFISGTSSQFIKGDGSLDSTSYVSGTPWTGMGYLTSLSGAVLTDQTTPQTIGATGRPGPRSVLSHHEHPAQSVGTRDRSCCGAGSGRCG